MNIVKMIKCKKCAKKVNIEDADAEGFCVYKCTCGYQGLVFKTNSNIYIEEIDTLD